MTVFPARRSVALKVATASSRAETLPMFVRSRPSRTRWTISLSWARSDSTTKSTARPSAGRASVGPTMDTWGTSKEENFADENFQRLLRDSCGQGELGAEFTDRLMTPHVGGGLT